jgi:hypothetical protein
LYNGKAEVVYEKHFINCTYCAVLHYVFPHIQEWQLENESCECSRSTKMRKKQDCQSKTRRDYTPWDDEISLQYEITLIKNVENTNVEKH